MKDLNVPAMTNPSPSPPTTAPLPACLTDALDQIDIGVMAIDATRRILYANAAVCDTLALTRDALVGQELWAAFPDLVGTVFEQQYTEVLAAQGPVAFEAPYARLGLWLHVRAVPSADGLAIYLTDITPEKRSDATLRAFLDASPDAAILLDRAGIVLDVNQLALNRMGTTRKALLGTNGYAALPPELAATRRARNEGVLQGGVPATFDDGRADALYTNTVVPIKDEQGQVTRLAIFSRDITAHKRAEAALRDIDHAKDEFLAVLSHELQTPLTSMLGFSEHALLQDTLETYRITVPIIQRNAKRQARLVNELLDMSKLLQGRVDCRPVAIDLGHLAMTMLERMLPIAEGGGLTLLMDPAHEPLPVLVDPNRLLVCLEHLIGNSIKFTPAGGRITLTCQRQDARAVLAVTDTGRGIDAAHLGLLFHPFQQVERDEAAGGLGLGLAVVRGYVEWHGGTVQADSPGPGHGSTFTLRLPLTIAEKQTGVLGGG
jgi:PAS domain S-box-containing protein